MSFSSSALSTTAWWESATLWATAIAAGFQILSWLLSFVAYYRKKRPHNAALIHLDRRIALEKTSLHSAGIASIAALAGAFFSAGYANRADRDSLMVHKQLAEAEAQSASASQTANQAVADLTETKKRLSAVTQDLAAAEDQLVAATHGLQALGKQQEWRALIMRMNADDALAFDSLTAMKASTDPVQNAMIKSALKVTIEAHGPNYTKNYPLERHMPTEEEAAALLDADDAYMRGAGLVRLQTILRKSALIPKLMPKVVRMSLSDPSLDVRTAATMLINAWTLDRFRALDKGQIQAWWETYGKKEYPSP